MRPEILQTYYGKYRFILFPVLVGIIALLVSNFVIFPQITKYFQGRDEISRLQDRINRLTTKTKDLEKLDNTAIAEKLDTSLRALPADRDLANMIGLIQSVAQQNGVILTALSLGSAASDAKGKFNPFVIRLEIGGGKDAFRNFVNNLEKAPRVMKVVTIDLALARASDSASATTAVELYYAPTPKELGALDAPLPTLTEKDNQILSDLQKSNISIPGQPLAAPVGGGGGSGGGTQQPTGTVPKGKVNPFN